MSDQAIEDTYGVIVLAALGFLVGGMAHLLFA